MKRALTARIKAPPFVVGFPWAPQRAGLALVPEGQAGLGFLENAPQQGSFPQGLPAPGVGFALADHPPAEIGCQPSDASLSAWTCSLWSVPHLPGPSGLEGVPCGEEPPSSQRHQRPSPARGLSCLLDWEPDIRSDLRLSRCTYPQDTFLSLAQITGGCINTASGPWLGAEALGRQLKGHLRILQGSKLPGIRKQGQWLGVQAVGPALLPNLRLGLNPKCLFKGQCTQSSCGAAPFLS